MNTHLIVLILLIVYLFSPLKTVKENYLPIHSVTTIKINRSSPAHIIYDSINDDSNSNSSNLDNENFKQVTINTLSILKNENIANYKIKYFLDELIVKKNISDLNIENSISFVENNNNSHTDIGFIEELNKNQKIRFEIAQSENLQKFKESINEVNSYINENKSLEQQKYSISGELEFQDGLAFTNDHSIEVRRVHEGIGKETGQVNLKEGTYSINIVEPVGYIYLGLRDSNGHIIGETQVKINSNNPSTGQSKQDIVLNSKRAVIKKISNPSGKIASYNDPEHKKKISYKISMFNGEEEIQLENKGHFEVPQLQLFSSTIVKSETNEHHPYLNLFYGADQKISIMPNSTVSAIKYFLLKDELEKLNDVSIAWGQARIDNKPISGVKVEVENDEAAKVIYLNELLLPDENLKQTSMNGYFIVLSDKNDMLSVAGFRDNKYFSFANYLSAPGFSSEIMLISTTPSEVIPIRSYDGITGAPVGSNLSIQSQFETIDLSKGFANILLPRIHRLGLLMADSNESRYLPTLMTYFDDQKYIHVPLINKDWLVKIKTSLQISDSIDGGVLVGFLGESNSDVSLAGDTQGLQTQIVYFDFLGKPVKSSIEARGGGFIIFNLPYTYHEVAIVDNENKKIYSNVIPVEDNFVSIIKPYRDF